MGGEEETGDVSCSKRRMMGTHVDDKRAERK